jgi:hypothetical protein
MREISLGGIRLGDFANGGKSSAITFALGSAIDFLPCPDNGYRHICYDTIATHEMCQSCSEGFERTGHLAGDVQKKQLIKLKPVALTL